MKREEIPVPIGGSFVVAAPLGLHTVKLLLQAALACNVSSHEIRCAQERRSKRNVVDGSIMIRKVVERLDRGRCGSEGTYVYGWGKDLLQKLGLWSAEVYERVLSYQRTRGEMEGSKF